MNDKQLIELGKKTLDFLNDSTKRFKARNEKEWQNMGLCEQMFLEGYITAFLELGGVLKDDSGEIKEVSEWVKKLNRNLK